MDKNTALLSYFVFDSSLFIATVVHDSVAYQQVKISGGFNQKLIDYHVDIKSAYGADVMASGVYLYKHLIKPVEDLVKDKKNWVIIPDGHLYYLPFGTLCKQPAPAGYLSSVDFLVKKHAFTYHHSATLWLNSRGKELPDSYRGNFIGFAPVFDPGVNNGYMLSNKWIIDSANVNQATRSISNDLQRFNTLPHSEKEIKAILRLFKKRGQPAKGYFHTKANEENFKQKAKNYNYVHIASHSFANDKYPALSGIAFSQPAPAIHAVEDGILYASESYDLDLSGAHLVVLSSCKSGLGKLIKGEGFLSLSRGFLFSGVPNIMFSLWSVEDKASRQLMIRFYRHLLKGQSYAGALRAAQLELLSNKKTSLPQYWAPWVLVGG